MILEDSKWKQLTSHQQIRHYSVKYDTTLQDVVDLVDRIESPFGADQARLTWSVEVKSDVPEYIIKVHAQRYQRGR